MEAWISKLQFLIQNIFFLFLIIETLGSQYSIGYWVYEFIVKVKKLTRFGCIKNLMHFSRFTNPLFHSHLMSLSH
jgi:hypothetical protein